MSSPGLHRLFRIAALTLFLLPACTVFAEDRPSMEYSVKAAMIYNMAKFVEWPEGRGGDSSEFAICVIGEGPFSGPIEALEGKRIKDRTVTVKRADSAAAAADCQIVFIGVPMYDRLDSAIGPLMARPVLVISDIDGFVEHGGDIGLVIVDNKVRFEINKHSANRKGLKVSSKLLKLADRVVDEGR